MRRFFTNTITNNFCTLTTDEAIHCIKVIRCRLEDKIEILDGNGNLYLAKIIAISKHEVVAEILETKISNAKNNNLSIGISLTKNPARFEWFVEKATEIGIHTIFPIQYKRTEKLSFKKDRIQNIILSASKQSLQLHFPIIEDVITLPNFIQKNANNFENKFVAHCEENGEKKALKNIINNNGNTIILIGPEGDLTTDEIQICIQNNFKPITLGNSILRVETAGIVACTLFNNL